MPSIRSCFGQLLLEIFNFALSSLGFQVQILDPKAKQERERELVLEISMTSVRLPVSWNFKRNRVHKGHMDWLYLHVRHINVMYTSTTPNDHVNHVWC